MSNLKAAFLQALRYAGVSFVAAIGPAQAITALADLKIVGSVYLWAALSAVNVGLVAFVGHLVNAGTPVNLGLPMPEK